jgi:histidinol-phosphate/aromatic aminotransferase/cobyric acid decarboxylase-like protein
VIPVASAHGGDGPAIAHALGVDPASILDLSQSLNPFAPDIARVASRRLLSLRHYPDARHATGLLAEAIGVDRSTVLLTNGGSEAIVLVRRAIGGRVIEPEFALHPRGTEGPTWRSNPHNPTGALAAPDDHADVWDEAFYPLATGTWTRGDADAIVVGSLTKVFACPGLRLGYVLAPSDVISTLDPPPWSVGSLPLALLPDLLSSAQLGEWRARIAQQRDALVALLSRLGIAARCEAAPWVLAEAPGLRERLAPRAVVVRDCASFGLPGVARIAVPDDDGLERLSRALEETA